ncbi:biotin--[acetyl-CoA-carboxylase] ligase [Corynebacterium guangdongense]|uniref:BirA family biotin operon repressor/biotin-[acetyl-CoA-carboxylase] ligase n=1 Tax=Corynebacterium guangdongense TaxID=1783348 RepID=A0ABU1ZV57_9CORY|nr:biotin--[acetyl-CoA-carboxylase] ligase [Corynebacterium guangdongense]MDR7328670.1 BirA family biotin operon repressor/biotin-[acetyl-CoA-carboxylase] ligase [Corynebacterium guangdongense]WJZ17247.1 Bifunctional ligase/repressor BirA [Corynebacterium guangdongense]
MSFEELYSRVVRVDDTGSTNADLLADDSAPHGALLIADHQTAGRGRLGRTWTAPAGTQLIFSTLLVVPQHDLERLGTLTLAAGLALTDVIDTATLKWPNDVLIDGRKLCGILAEAAPAADGSYRVVIGVGLNHLLTREQLPVAHATSLALEGVDLARAELEEQLFSALARRLRQWRDNDPALMADYRAVCSSIGQRVRLQAPTGDVLGVVDTVADDGRILIDGAAYSAGDVTHLRLA